VDQIARMRHQGADRAARVRGAESLRLLVADLPAAPLIRILDEDLDGRAFKAGGALERGRQSAGHRDMGTEGGEGGHRTAILPATPAISPTTPAPKPAFPPPKRGYGVGARGSGGGHRGFRGGVYSSHHGEEFLPRSGRLGF